MTGSEDRIMTSTKLHLSDRMEGTTPQDQPLAILGYKKEL